MVSREGDEDAAAKEAIGAFNDALLRAIGAADLSTLEALTYERYVTIGDGGPAARGREAALDVYRRAAALFRTEETWTPAETLIDGEIAYQRGAFLIRVIPHLSGRELETGGTYLNVYRLLDEGRWTLVMNSFRTEHGAGMWDEVMAPT